MHSFEGAHFEREIILACVRQYVAYPLSYRQLEEMIEKRGVTIAHSTINRWGLKYAPELEKAFRRRKRPVGHSWRMDATSMKVNGQWKFLALLLPNTWSKIFHDQPYIDPQGLLRRTGAVWVAFALLQFIAYMKWPEQPYWLAVIAGVRLTELFSDWAYLYFAQHITRVGRLSLLIAPPANLVMGWFFIKSFLKLTTGK